MRDKEYLAQVRRHLTCSAASRQRLMDRADQMVEDFFRENPEGDGAALTTAFGGPQEFAAQMLATLEPEEVAAARERRRLAKRGLVVLAVLVFMLITLLAVRQCQRYETVIPNGEYGVIQPAHELTEEEFNAMVQAAQKQEGEK